MSTRRDHDRRVWLEIELRRAIANAHTSPTAKTSGERAHYILAAIAAAAGIGPEQLTDLLNNPPKVSP